MKIGSREYSEERLLAGEYGIWREPVRGQPRWPDIGAFRGGCVAADRLRLRVSDELGESISLDVENGGDGYPFRPDWCRVYRVALFANEVLVCPEGS